MTRDEMISLRFTQSSEIQKRASSDEIARDVDEFLRRGGVIQQIAAGVSGVTDPPKFVVVTEAQKRRSAAAHAAKRTSGKLSLTAAARMAGMTIAEFRALVARGKGPTAFAQGHAYRFEESAVREWLDRRAKIEADIASAMASLKRTYQP
jgi:predicted DNA-binding transcriptional regulator AlpA